MQLLNKDPNERPDWDEIKTHEWFNEMCAPSLQYLISHLLLSDRQRLGRCPIHGATPRSDHTHFQRTLLVSVCLFYLKLKIRISPPVECGMSI